MKRKLLSVLLILSMLLSAAPAHAAETGEDGNAVSAEAELMADAENVAASGSCGDSVTWHYDGAGTLTISGTGPMSPGSNSMPWDPYSQYITTAVVEEGVTTVCDHAFDLYWDNITSISLPSAITSIGEWAFYDLRGLTELQIPQAVTTIGEYAFCNCTTLSTLVLPQGLTTIGSYAFQGCRGLSEIVLPDSVTTVGDNLFEGCAYLTSAVVGSGITSMGKGMFMDCTRLKDLTIRCTMTEIPDRMFNSCSSLSQFTVPDTVTRIGFAAFGGCTSLKDWYLPESVTTIDDSAFNRSGFSHVVIPDSVTSIGEQSFAFMPYLLSVDTGDGLTSIPLSAFENNSRLQQVHIGKNVRALVKDAAWGNTFAESTTIQLFEVDPLNQNFAAGPNGELMNKAGTTIYNYPAGRAASGYTIPAGVAYIDDAAFYKASSLTSITLPESISRIGLNAFYYCGSTCSFFFEGDAPSLATKSGSSAFPSYSTLYYLTGRSGWTTPKWNGYTTVGILSADGAFTAHDGNYYRALPNRYFLFTDEKGAPLPQVSLHYGSTDVPLGDQSETSLSIDTIGGLELGFSHESCHSASLPTVFLGTTNQVKLHTTSASVPFVQFVYGLRSSDSAARWSDMLHSGLTFTSADSEETTQFYIDVNWNGQPEGKIYLSQTLDTAGAIQLEAGYSQHLGLSKTLLPGSPLLLLLELTDGTLIPTELKSTVLPPVITAKVALAESVNDQTLPGHELFSKFKFGIDISKVMELKLEVAPDGTFTGVFGVNFPKKNEGKIFEYSTAIKEAFSNNRTEAFADAFTDLGMEPLPMDSLDLAIKTKGQGFGFVEGVIEDGVPWFTDAGLAVMAEGKVEYTWNFISGPVPFYLRAGFGVEAALQSRIVQNPSEEYDTYLKPGTYNAELKFPLEGAAGVGVDEVVSAGLNTKMDMVLGFDIPSKSESDSYLYAQGSVGVEAKFLGIFDTDFEIFSTDKSYIWGEPTDEAILQAFENVDLSQAQWKSMSRDYLYGDSAQLLAVDPGSTSQSSTDLTATYPGAHVQTAALPNGGLLVVWTHDPGESVRPCANNRPMLYYAYYNGSYWSYISPVAVPDDGTADCNPTLVTVDGTIYLLWQNASRPLTDQDSVETVPGVMDIACARFDTATYRFTLLGSFGTSGYDGAPSITHINSQPAVYYAASDTNDPIGMTGTGTLHRAVFDGTEWTDQILTAAPGAVSATAASAETLWYAWKDESGSHLCSFDGTVSIPLSPEALNASRPSFVDGVLTWYADGAVVANGEFISLEESTDRYQYLRSGTGIQAVLYTIPGNDRCTSLCASFNDGSGWGEPIIIAGGDRHITSFHGQFLSDGTLKIAICGQAVTYDTNGSPVLSSGSTLQICQISLHADLAVTGIDYLAHSLVRGGTLDVHLQLENQGAVGIQCVQVDIMRSSTVYATQTYQVGLSSGESTSLFVPFPLPSSIMSGYYAKVTPVGLTDKDTRDNTKDINLRLQDVSVEDTIVTRCGQTLEVVTTVASRGISAVSNVTVTLTDEAGTVLGTSEVDSLNAGDNTFCRFTVTQDLPEGSTLTVTASGPENENLFSNNSRTVLVPEKEKTAFHLTARKLTSEAATSVMVTAINPTDSAVSCLLYCASYDAHGKMLHVSSPAQVDCAAGAQAIYQLDLKADPHAVEVRIFTMTGTYIPYLNTITPK